MKGESPMNNLFPCGEEFQPKVPKDIFQLRESFDNRSPELPDELLVGASTAMSTPAPY